MEAKVPFTETKQNKKKSQCQQTVISAVNLR